MTNLGLVQVWDGAVLKLLFDVEMNLIQYPLIFSAAALNPPSAPSSPEEDGLVNTAAKIWDLYGQRGSYWGY